MTAERFEEIKEKIEVLKKKKMKAEANIENVEERLKQEFDIDTIADAEKKLVGLNTEITELEGRLEKLTDKIEKSAEWDEVDE